MVLRFTAKVKKREVVVRGVDLPDGATVDVTIDPQAEDELTAEELAEIDRQERASMAAYRRGEYYLGEDFIRWVRGGPPPVLVRDQRTGTTGDGPRERHVASAPRKRKSIASRNRKRR